MKIVDVPTLVLTSKERGKIVDLVSMLYDTDSEVDSFIDSIMEETPENSLLGILEEILDRARVSD